MRRFLTPVVMLTATTGIAAAERAAVVAIDTDARVPAHLVVTAKATIANGLASAGYDVVEVPQLTGALATCRIGPCVHAIALSDHVEAVVFAAIVMNDESSIIDLVLFDGATAQQLAHVHSVCDLCGQSELDERLGVAASALRAQAAEATAQKSRLDAMIYTPPVEPSTPSLVPGIALGIGGLVAVGVGVYLWSLDGDGTCHAGDKPVYPAADAVIRYPDPNDPSVFVCRDLYHTTALAAVTAGVGVAAIAVGVVLVIHARDDRHAIELAPTPGGARVGFAVRW